MRYRLLGTAQAFQDDGTPVALGGARLRALLTVLALRAGRSVPVGVLVGEVWDGDPPADAVAALQALVGRLRRALGRDAVVSSEGGYRLTADEDDVDLHRFGRLAGEGARALEDGDAGKAAVLLDEALALWHGPALADLPDRASEVLRWDTRRLEARRARLTAALALGRAEDTLPELAALCEEYPLDEPLQALRIRALRDASRTAEALAAYDEVRHVLADRLGTDPGPELRALHEDLLHGSHGPASGRRDTAMAPRRGSPRRDTAPASEPGPYGSPPGPSGTAPGPATGPDTGPEPRTGRARQRRDEKRQQPHGSPSPEPSHPQAHPPERRPAGTRPDEARWAEAPSGSSRSGGSGSGEAPWAERRPDGSLPDEVQPGGTRRDEAGSDRTRSDEAGESQAGVASARSDGRRPDGSGSGGYGPDGYGPGGYGSSEARRDGSGSDRTWSDEAAVDRAGSDEWWSEEARWDDASSDGPWSDQRRPDRNRSDDVAWDGHGSRADRSDVWRSGGDRLDEGWVDEAPADEAPAGGGGSPYGSGGRGRSGAEGGQLSGHQAPDRPREGLGGRPGHGQGRQRGGTAPSPSGTSLSAPSPSVAAPGGPAPGNLRARLTSFVGREGDIDAIRADLSGARLVTLLGPGGAGKTRLSQEAAERASGAWPDGVWLAELAPVDDPETVADAVLTSLGARETVLRGAGAEEFRAVDRQAGEPLVRLAEHCARRRMLLLLDNCEHVIGAAATLAEELLARCPNLTVLATSREPLGVPGEVVRPVEPLPPRSAHRLFTERARSVRPDFDPDADPAAVAEICRRLDGLPLAIELAAARLRLLSPRQIADRLDDRFRLLTSGSRTVLPRQQTLRAVVDWSWDLLDEAERAVLRRLSVFAGGCGLAAVEEVCAGTTPGDPVRSPDVPALLGSLVDKSLVVAAPSPDGDMRYRLLETVAEYAAERLDQAGEGVGDQRGDQAGRHAGGHAGDRAATERRHLVHYRELARTTDPLLRGSGQLAAIALLQLEHENFRTALRRAVAARDEHEVLCMVLSLAWFWSMRDMRGEGRQWAAAAASLGPDPFAPPAEPAPPLHLRCTDLPPPMADDQLIEARRQVRIVEMVTLEHAEDEWESPERQEWLRNVARVYRAGLPQTCRFPASLWFFATLMHGGDERLRHVLDETVAACERFGYDWELAGALQMRANILANRGAWADDADRDAGRALRIYDALGDAWGRAEALSARGEARERRGEYGLAVADFAAAIGHVESLGARSQVAVLRARMASSMFETDRAAEGEAILRAVLDDSHDVSHESLIAARLFLALRLGRTGRGEEARWHLGVISEAFRHETLAVFQGFIQGTYAWLDCEDGRYAEALEEIRNALRQSHSVLSQMVAPHMAAGYLATAAWALAGLAGDDKERAREAARLLGASDALTPAGHFRPPTERELLAASRRAVLAAMAALGDEDAFGTAYADGGRLSLEEAVARV
ncbi:BTAD domain-containing putative transcriptional regulator [Streptomyces sp. NPDC006638]|uniref:BTAD domain-containing putative transcriptional regulator n=1 Tax=Streptomyces sp. NPDC006638 TaxID=3157183 RepID=UPI0033AC2189